MLKIYSDEIIKNDFIRLSQLKMNMEPATSFFTHPLRSTCRCMFGLVLLYMQFAYAQTFEWGNTIGTNLPAESVQSVCTDNDGNVYVTGTVTATYYSFSTNNHYAHFGNDSLLIHGANDIYVAKYNSNGLLLWAKTFGGSYDWNIGAGNQLFKYEKAIRILVMDGNLFLTAQVYGPCSINNSVITNINGQSKLVLLKINLDGNIQWVKTFGSSNGINGGGILAQFKDKLLMSGWTENTFQIDSTNSVHGSYLCLFTTGGNLIWVKSYFDSKADFKEIHVQDNHILTLSSFGKFNSINFDSLIICQDSTKTGSLISELDSLGNIKWFRTFTSNGYYVAGNRISCIDSNKCFCQLNYTSDLFESTDTIDYSAKHNSCIVRFTSDGTIKTIRPTNSVYVNQISVINKKLMIVGSITQTDTLFDAVFTNNSELDLLIIELDSSLQVHNSYQSGIGQATDVIQLNDSGMLIAGIVGKNSPGNYNLNLGNLNLVSHGFEDGFIAKFNGFTSGIDDRSKKVNSSNESLLIYANPSNGVCDVEIPEAFIHEKELILNIYSNTGVLIQQVKVDMSEAVIKVDIQQQAKGMYTATLSKGSKLYKGRIVFE